MDTRGKIIDAAHAGSIARDGRKRTAVVAHFDPIYAPHVRRLRELADGSCLVVVLTEPPFPLLPQRARAELAAGLAMVDYVIMTNAGEISTVLDRLSPDSIVWEDAADEQRTLELMKHVCARQRSGSSGE